MIKSRKFSKGIRLKGTTDAATLDGEIRNDSAAKKIKVNIDAAERSIVTEDQTATLTNKTIDANGTGNSISNLETADFATNVVDTDTALTADSDTRIASQKATKAYIDNGLAGQNEASEINYSNATSGLTATDVQAAVDEVEGRVDSLETDSHTHSNKTVLDNTTASYTTAEETKLAGIEASATADQSDAEIKTAYENNANTNEYSDAEQTKLGAIEALADVTDAVNVNAAGATMNSDTTLVGNGYFLDEDNMVSDDATKVPSQQSVKAFVEGKVLNDTSDVSAASPNSGEVLTYNSLSGDWESKTPEGGLKNYITNGKAEASTTGWTVYKNTSVGDLPDDFGGSASGNLTFTRNTTTPLSGLADFKLTTTAANLQGEGVYYQFTADKVDLATMLTAIIRKDSSDSGIADGDYRYVLVSSNDSFSADFNIIRVNGENLNGSDNDNLFQFQTDASDVSYRFCIHRAVTTATATSIYLDEMEIGPRSVAKGGAASATKRTTPTLTFTGTTSTNTMTYYRDGKYLIGEGLVVSSGAGSVTPILVTLPESLVMDEPDIASINTTYNMMGQMRFRVNSSSVSTNAVTYNSPTTFRFKEVGTDNNFDGSNFLSGRSIYYEFKFPIKGWETNTVMSEDIGNRDIIVDGAGNDGTSVTAFTTNINFTETEDSSASFNGTLFTAPERGRYAIDGGVYFTTNALRELVSYIDESSNKFMGVDDNVLTSFMKFNQVVTLEKGQQYSVRSSVTSTLSNDVQRHYITITKLANPQTILETATVAADYTSSNGQALTTTEGLLTYEEKVTDTHNMYSGGVLTIPVSGLYQVNASYGTDATSMSRASVILQVNDVTTIEGRDSSNAAATIVFNPSLSRVFYLEKGDEVKIRGDVTTTANMIADSTLNNFSIARIK